MYCNTCGNMTSGDSEYCNRCGSKISNSVKYNSQNKKKNKKLKIILIIFLCVIFLFFILYIALISVNISANTIGTQLTKTYINKEDGIYFRYPEGWSKDEALSNQEKYILYLKSPKVTVNYPHMVINKLHKDDFEYEPYTKDEIYYLFTDLGWNVEEVVDTKIDNIDAVKAILTSDKFQKVITYYYVINGDSYQVTFDSLKPSFDEYEPIYDAIMESYKITPSTEYITQQQNPDDYGLSSEEALEVAQQFIDTHPLLKHKLTGEIEYEPQIDEFSTKGLYRVVLVKPDGAREAMFVDKRTGSVLLSLGGGSLEDGEKVYNEIVSSKQTGDAILYRDISISKYLESDTDFVYDNLGPAVYGTDIDGLYYDGWDYIGYDGVSFLYYLPFDIERICGNPEFFVYNGDTLNKNYDEIVELFGAPSNESTLYDNVSKSNIYNIEFDINYYIIQFQFSNKTSDAFFIDITEK